MSAKHVDVLIVGAGMSGIGVACHLRRTHPDRSYAILEAREVSGGTWDLFRYPGIRSDSDMHTFGFGFRPWESEDSIADGPAILKYLRETAVEYGVDQHIIYRRKLVAADWSSEQGIWTVEAVRQGNGETEQYTCNFLLMNTGYYQHDSGYQPEFAGRDRYRGEFVHPQFWPEELDYAGKKVVVIGSGATAVTLVPTMAGTAEHVTMLQRSPTYIVAQPKQDPLDRALRKVLPLSVSYPIVKWANILKQVAIYKSSKAMPRVIRKGLIRMVAKQLPKGYDVETDFGPRYNPWDQRLCLVPDGDLFRSIRNGQASVVTDQIDTFTENGIRLRSGKELEADIVVSATGLNMSALSGIRASVDGVPVDVSKVVVYRDTMASGVPNFAFTFGYINSSWTLKVDLTADFICRLMKHMDEHGYHSVVPQITDPSMKLRRMLDFKAGYMERSAQQFPLQGDRRQWQVRMSYLSDYRALRSAKFDVPELGFSARKKLQAKAEA